MVEISSKYLLNFDKEINVAYDKIMNKYNRLKLIIFVLLLTLFSLICLILYYFYFYH